MSDFKRNDIVEIIADFHSMDPFTGQPLPYPSGYRFRYAEPDSSHPGCSTLYDLQRNAQVPHVPDRLLRRIDSLKR